MMGKSNKPTGFTIVELLIVIVVIGILASITIVAYGGIQARARDSQRQSDVESITKALELYYLDNGHYPPGSGSTVINVSWSTTGDASWPALATALKPYLGQMPVDPVSTPGSSILGGTGYNYAYFANSAGGYCGTGVNQTYILVYRFENIAQADSLNGGCGSNPVGPYSSGTDSNYRRSKP